MALRVGAGREFAAGRVVGATMVRIKCAPCGSGMNHWCYGDNLKVLRDSIKDDSGDLILVDTPFNSNASYNVLFMGPKGTGSTAQIEAFDDTWHWNDSAGEAFGDVMRGGSG